MPKHKSVGYEDIEHILDFIETPEEFENFIKSNKLTSARDLTEIQKNIIAREALKRYDLKQKDLDLIMNSPKDINKLTSEIVNTEYPGLNKIREVIGKEPIQTVVDDAIVPKGAAGAYEGLMESSKGYSGGNIRMKKNLPNQNWKLSTLLHEIGHGNDDVSQLIAKLVANPTTENQKKLKRIIEVMDDNQVQSYLQEATQIPNILNQKTTNKASQFTVEKILSQKEAIERAIKEGNTDLIPLLKKYEQLEKTTLPEGNSVLKNILPEITDSVPIDKISEAVPDNRILTSRSDYHHLPRVDEVTKVLDKGNWEMRNIGRLLSGKNLKSMATTAAPMTLKALGLGAAAAAAMGIGEKAMAGEYGQAAMEAGDVATDYIPIVGNAKMALSSEPLGDDAESRAIEDPSSKEYQARMDALKKYKEPKADSFQPM